MRKEFSYLDEEMGPLRRLRARIYAPPAFRHVATLALRGSWATPSHEAARQRRRFFKKGIIALPLMLLISGIVLEMTIASTLIIFYLLQGSSGAKNATEALATAQSGINDASLQLVRDKGYSNVYTFTVDAQHVAQVTVCNQGHKSTGCGVSGGCTNLTDMGRVEITALGKVKGRNKCVRAIYNLNGETGEMKMESSAEIAL